MWLCKHISRANRGLFCGPFIWPSNHWHQFQLIAPCLFSTGDSVCSHLLNAGSSLADLSTLKMGDTFPRNVGLRNIYTAPYPRRRHSSYCLKFMIGIVGSSPWAALWFPCGTWKFWRNRAQIGVNWSMIGTSNCVLWTRWLTFGLHKIRGLSWDRLSSVSRTLHHGVDYTRILQFLSVIWKRAVLDSVASVRSSLWCAQPLNIELKPPSPFQIFCSLIVFLFQNARAALSRRTTISPYPWIRPSLLLSHIDRLYLNFDVC
jgi:hypothetical protein